MAKAFNKINYDSKRDGKLLADQVYVEFDNKGDNNFFKLSDIKYAFTGDLEGLTAGDDISPRLQTIESVAEFNELKRKQGIHFYWPNYNRYNWDQEVYKRENNSTLKSAVLYPASTVDALNGYTSNNIEPVATNNSWQPVQKGMQRTVNFAAEKWNGEDAYVMVKFAGDSTPHFVRKSDLIFTDKKGNVQTYLNSSKYDDKTITIKGLNQEVAEIYIGTQYQVDRLLDYYAFDTKNAQQIHYHLMVNDDAIEKEEDMVRSEINVEVSPNAPVSYEATVVEEFPKYFSVQTPVEVEEVVPYNVLRTGGQQTEKVHKIKCENYELSESGSNLIVKPKYSTAQTVVEKDNLFLDKDCTISIENLSAEELVGKTLYAKVKNEFNEETIVEIEALTYRQAAMAYNKIESLQQTSRLEDVLADNAYLKLADGTAVKETEIAKPIAYKVLDRQELNADFYDAYVVVGDDGNTYVVDKNAFPAGGEVSLKFGDKKVRISRTNAVKIQRTHDLDEADVIQTTSLVPENEGNSTRKIDACKTLGQIQKGKFFSLEQEEREKAKEAANKEFTKEYKKGSYYLPKTVIIDGEEKQLQDVTKRYVMSDAVYMQDYAHEGLESYSTDPLVYSERDGKFKLAGGPKFNPNKANLKFLSKWSEYTLKGLMIASSGGGFISLIAWSSILTISAATLAVGAPLAIGINAVRSLIKNHVHDKYKDKTITNKKKWTKDIEKELAATKELSKGKQLSEDAVRQKMQGIKTLIISQGASRFETKFKNKDGVIAVDENNAALAHEHRSKVRPLIKERNSTRSKLDKVNDQLAALEEKKKTKLREKRIGRKVARANILADKLGAIDADIEGMKSIEVSGASYKEHPKHRQLLQTAENLQAFMLLKNCGVSDLTDEQLASLDYSVKKDKFYVNGKELDMGEENDITKAIKAVAGNNLGNEQPAPQVEEPAVEAETFEVTQPEVTVDKAKEANEQRALEAAERKKKMLKQIGTHFGGKGFDSKTGKMRFSAKNVEALISAMDELDAIGTRIATDEIQPKDYERAEALQMFMQEHKRFVANTRAKKPDMINGINGAVAKYNSYVDHYEKGQNRVK